MKHEMGDYDDGMERRIDKLESDIAVIKSNYTTKADLTASVNSLIKWIVGTAIGLGAAGITVITFVLNNASSQRVASQPQPIVIYAQPASSPPGSAARTP
jgi:hypothetical protein